MDHRLDLLAVKKLPHLLGIKQRADMEVAFGNSVAKAGRKVIKNGNGVAPLHQLVNGVRTDVTGPACN